MFLYFLTTSIAAGSFAGATAGVCDLLDNLNIKDNTGDIETALESLKLQVSYYTESCYPSLGYISNLNTCNTGTLHC